MTFEVPQDMKTPLGEYYRCEAWMFMDDNVTYCAFPVVRKTRNGAVLSIGGKDVHVQELRCGRPVRKRYAYPTKAEALEALYKQKLEHIEILNARLKGAKEELIRVERERVKPSFILKLLPASNSTVE